MAFLSVFFTISKVKYGIVKVFGYSVCYVLTGSMEPRLKIGEVVLIKEATSDNDVAVGDIITYKSSVGIFSGKYITHRVVGKEMLGDGSFHYTTKGDANAAVDTEFITLQKIEGVYQRKIVAIQIFLSIFSSPIVFFLVIILPLLVVFANQIKHLIITFKSGKGEEEIPIDEETLKQFIEQQSEKHEKNNKNDEENNNNDENEPNA